MPPFISRKRHRSPPQSSRSGGKKKQTVFQAAEALEMPKSKHTAEENKKYLEDLQEDEDDDDESHSSEMDSDDFEDAMPGPSHKRRKLAPDDDEEASDDNEMDWEDVVYQRQDEPTISGDLELTLDSVNNHSHGSLSNPLGSKKGPTKIERAIRWSVHCMHVQCLLQHNYVRNIWLNDKKVQKNLVEPLLMNTGMRQEVEKWRKACAELFAEDMDEDKAEQPGSSKSKGKIKSPAVAKEKSKKANRKSKQRDWGADAEVEGSPTLANGDPTVRLLKALTGYWRKKFTITTSGLRKQGYKDAARLETEIRSLRTDPHDPEVHGEKIGGIEELRYLARKCEGSRDLGAQLFTALLRGLGVEARMVASLQPIGFAWTKAEEAHPAKKKATKIRTATTPSKLAPIDSDLEILDGPHIKRQKISLNGSKLKGRKHGGSKDTVIEIADDSEVRTPAEIDSDEASVIDITPLTPSKVIRRFDRDLMFPIYWTEALSPVSQTWIPADPLVINVIATKDEDVQKFEPRGTQADKAKQVIAYVIGFAADRSAKDITTRYLKKHMWPGKTKGVRIPVEKIQVSGRRSKTKRYAEYDWFRRVMRNYQRPTDQWTKSDRIEDARELEPAQAVKKEKKQGEETLQDYKSSEEFVLERFLHREEAFIPGAEPVRTFKTGKGDKEKEEAVYQRKDVVTCKTVESWHKEGREVREGEQPLKWVPIRAVTTIRKREILEAERESGEKQKQGLYSKAQTKWIIPDPIINGCIPKNSFGNMDVYVPTMIPEGAVHVARRGTAKICKRLGIDFAEACTGFEFGNRRAIPILTGVVVARENVGVLIDAWKVDEELKRQKEEDKREKLALTMWKKMMAGLRVVEKMKKKYGDQAEQHLAEALNGLAKKGQAGKKEDVKKNTKAKQKAVNENVEDDEDFVGKGGSSAYGNGSGRFVLNEDDAPQPGGFFVDQDDSVSKPSVVHTPMGYLRTPISLQEAHRVSDRENDLSPPPIEFEDEGPVTTSRKKKMPTQRKTSKPRASKRKSIIEVDSDVDLDDDDSEEEFVPLMGKGGKNRKVKAQSTRQSCNSGRHAGVQ